MRQRLAVIAQTIEISELEFLYVSGTCILLIVSVIKRMENC